MLVLGSWPSTSRVRSQGSRSPSSDRKRNGWCRWSGGLPHQVGDRVIALLQEARKAPAFRSELQKATDLNDRKHFKASYVDLLVKAGWLKETLQDKPTSRAQRYRLTPEGLVWLERAEKQLNP
jgi:hypothetical protein